MKIPFESILLGTAVGDSIGLPAEGLSTSRIAKRWPGPWKQRLLFGNGMVSDDTEHTVFVAQSLLEAPADPEHFARRLAARLRLWLLCIPAGIGFATLRAILKLWAGFPPEKSGVFSAGNGPAMRSAILGVYFAGDLETLRAYVRASTRLTHTDPKAETAAMAVALTAAWASTSTAAPAAGMRELTTLWASAGSDPDWSNLAAKIAAAHGQALSVQEFARSLGLGRGITGYAYHTVPMALYAWLRHFGNFQESVESIVRCGGDTDTAGSITGALAALNSSIPQEWLNHLRDYPVSVAYLRELATALDASRSGGGHFPLAFSWPLVPIRNLLFLGVILVHGFRRLLPL